MEKRQIESCRHCGRSIRLYGETGIWTHIVGYGRMCRAVPRLAEDARGGLAVYEETLEKDNAVTGL